MSRPAELPRKFQIKAKAGKGAGPFHPAFVTLGSGPKAAISGEAGSIRAARRPEAIHAIGPLQADNGALDRGQ